MLKQKHQSFLQYSFYHLFACVCILRALILSYLVRETKDNQFQTCLSSRLKRTRKRTLLMLSFQSQAYQAIKMNGVTKKWKQSSAVLRILKIILCVTSE